MTARGERGSVLVLALLTMLLVLTAAMSLSHDASRRLAVAVRIADGAEAQYLSVAGLEYACVRLGLDPTWTVAADVAPDPEGGTFKVVAQTASELTRALVSTGVRREAEDTVTATARPVPHPALGYHACTFGGITFESGANVGNSLLRAHGDVGATAPILFGGEVTVPDGALVTPLILPAQVFRASEALPAPAPQAAFFAARCTAITGLPEPVPGTLLMDHAALTSTHNSLGPSPGPGGRYTIDCLGKGLRIRRSFLRGMLVVRNCAALSIEDGVHFERHETGYPTLLCYGGPMTIRLGDVLNEFADDLDYNGDGDHDDVHPSQIAGIAWGSAAVVLRGSGTIRGCLIGTSLTLGESPVFQSDPTLESDRVLGFVSSSPWELDPGSLGVRG